MTSRRGGWAVVLVAALVALGTSLAWAATRRDHGHWGMMSYGSGMMGYADPGGGEPVRDLAGARRQAERFADRLDLRVSEVMRFSDGYYAELEENDGSPATEILVDPDRGAVWPEYGPAMMWNTRFGMMRAGSGAGMADGMMGWMMERGGSMGAGAPRRSDVVAGPRHTQWCRDRRRRGAQDRSAVARRQPQRPSRGRGDGLPGLRHAPRRARRPRRRDALGQR